MPYRIEGCPSKGGPEIDQTASDRSKPMNELFDDLKTVLENPRSPRYPSAQERILSLFAESETGLVSRSQILSLFEGQVRPDGTANRVLSRLKQRLDKHGFSIAGEYHYRLTLLLHDDV